MNKNGLRVNTQISILILFILGLFIFIYFLIPVNNIIRYNVQSECSQNGANRIVLNSNTWGKWWPGKKEGSNFYYEGAHYKINKIIYSGINFTVFKNSDSTAGRLVIEGSESSTIFEWESTFLFSKNPVKRIIKYFDYLSIKKNIRGLLYHLKNYFDKEENIYGIKIEKQNVSDKSLISFKQTFNHEPDTKDIYTLIDSLELYIHNKGGQKTNFPMLNINTDDNINYNVMVALPTSFELPSERNFKLKRMVMGKILMSEIKGGPESIKNGEMEMNNYLNDYKKISPAIYFESLVTNRRTESDTSKWITRLYFPIFN
ncbi:MAG: hypothetical protein NVSMB45_09580 [Ginsengibacter sp.]